jgi:hypothetical protein
MRAGHSSLKASLNRFNIVSTAECECGDGLQTEARRNHISARRLLLHIQHSYIYLKIDTLEKKTSEMYKILIVCSQI